MIEIKNLSYSYNDKDHALVDVNFKINDHEWVAILGHNGSGKSTFSKLLVGLLKATNGSISYDDVILDEKSVNDIRKKVGIVFQNPDNQFVGVNVKYDVAFGLENRLIEREEMNLLIDKYLSAVNMQDMKEREPNTLSGGQKQRVAIAGVLALNTDIIILDEATSMLDPDGVSEITKLIVDLKNKYHKTVITITHDLDLAKKADRVIILKEGNVIFDGSPFEAFKDDKLLASSNLDMPFDLKLYEMVKSNEKLKNNKELERCLWEYHLKK